MDAQQQCVPQDKRDATYLIDQHDRGFQRPQLTRYVRAFNSRASLLYWKARGERTDNLLDDTYPSYPLGTILDVHSLEAVDSDIDYGAAHPNTDITDDELGLLARWIDLGAAGGNAKVDTQKPTLHLAGILSGDSVTELRIGTNDLGEGVNPASLEVCVLGAGESCTDLSGDADPHGIVSIVLASPLSDKSMQVLARVSDNAGNVTEVRRTVGWLLNTPPPPPPGRPRSGGGSKAKLVGGCGLVVSQPVDLPWLVIGFTALVFARRSRR